MVEGPPGSEGQRLALRPSDADRAQAVALLRDQRAVGRLTLEELGGFWPVWPLAGWGFGLALHGLRVLLPRRAETEAGPAPR